eukprot:scaffold89523_cov29-Prasinocladus_malaysianus.AAC.1
MGQTGKGNPAAPMQLEIYVIAMSSSLAIPEVSGWASEAIEVFRGDKDFVSGRQLPRIFTA